jgi:hypothetical protein
MSPAGDHVEHLADDFVHELLSPDDARRVRRHCKLCLGCKAAVRSAAAVGGPAKRSREAAPEALITSTLRASKPTSPRVSVSSVVWRGSAAGGRGAVLLLVSLHIYYLNLAPTPYDLQVLGRARLWPAAPPRCVRLMDRVKGVALAGVPVELTLRGRTGSVKLANLTTDADGYGTPRVQVPDWNEDGCELVVTGRPGGAARRAAGGARRTGVEADAVERQAGVSAGAGDPPAGADAERFDRKPRRAGRRRSPSRTRRATSSSSAGRGEALQHRVGRLPAGRRVDRGAYTVRCQVEDTTAALTVEVKRYVLPKFKVEVETDRPYYAPGATLKATVRQLLLRQVGRGRQR